jgi:hypothetical protein
MGNNLVKALLGGATTPNGKEYAIPIHPTEKLKSVSGQTDMNAIDDSLATFAPSAGKTRKPQLTERWNLTWGYLKDSFDRRV